MCFATKAKEWKRSEETIRKDAHKHLKPRTSTPKGPAFREVGIRNNGIAE